VQRPRRLDYVGIKLFGDDGKPCGECRFIGLYTHTAYRANPGSIPMLRCKVVNVRARAGLAPGGHAAKQLENILDTYPRDELLQIDEQALFDQAMQHDYSAVIQWLETQCERAALDPEGIEDPDRIGRHVGEEIRRVDVLAADGLGGSAVVASQVEVMALPNFTESTPLARDERSPLVVLAVTTTKAIELAGASAVGPLSFVMHPGT